MRASVPVCSYALVARACQSASVLSYVGGRNRGPCMWEYLRNDISLL